MNYPNYQAFRDFMINHHEMNPEMICQASDCLAAVIDDELSGVVVWVILKTDWEEHGFMDHDNLLPYELRNGDFVETMENCFEPLGEPSVDELRAIVTDLGFGNDPRFNEFMEECDG